MTVFLVRVKKNIFELFWYANEAANLNIFFKFEQTSENGATVHIKSLNAKPKAIIARLGRGRCKNRENG